MFEQDEEARARLISGVMRGGASTEAADEELQALLPARRLSVTRCSILRYSNIMLMCSMLLRHMCTVMCLLFMAVLSTAFHFQTANIRSEVRLCMA